MTGKPSITITEYSQHYVPFEIFITIEVKNFSPDNIYYSILNGMYFSSVMSKMLTAYHKDDGALVRLRDIFHGMREVLEKEGGDLNIATFWKFHCDMITFLEERISENNNIEEVIFRPIVWVHL